MRKMASLVKYAFLLVADLVIIGCVVHYILRMLHWHAPFEERFLRYRKFEELKLNSYYAVVLLGISLTLYGSLIFLFSWMPHQWATYSEEGNPILISTMLSILGALFGTPALLVGLERTASKISELTFREAKAEAFQKLIKQELDQFGRVLRHSELEAELLVKLENKIEEAEKSRTIYPEDAGVCRNLLSTLRMALSERPNRHPA
jgi:hypothetical protein